MDEKHCRPTKSRKGLKGVRNKLIYNSSVCFLAKQGGDTILG